MDNGAATVFGVFGIVPGTLSLPGQQLETIQCTSDIYIHLPKAGLTNCGRGTSYQRCIQFRGLGEPLSKELVQISNHPPAPAWNAYCEYDRAMGIRLINERHSETPTVLCANDDGPDDAG